MTKKTDHLSAETGGYKKKWTGRLPAALVFPNTYSLGMSNLGFQLVYDLLNRHPDIVCERVFYPEVSDRPLSVESGRPLRDFPLILCSVSFEQDFPRLARMLKMGGIEALSVRRRECPVCEPGFPLVIGGGVATFINPEPLAPFVDMFLIGEAEPLLPGIMNRLLTLDGREDRQALLREFAEGFPGCYVPSLYEVRYHADGRTASISAEDGIPARVGKVCAPLQPVAGHSVILTPEAEFSNLFLTELGRGCSRGCRFCAAGFVYRPPRLWPAASVLASLEERPAKINRVGLLGMEMARPADLRLIASALMDSGCSLSFSSLRADAIGPELIELLSKSGLKSAAIAPDGGSERLRRVINKGLSEDDLLLAAESLVRAGVTNLKLYFMIGLPTETREDMEELVALTLRIKARVLSVGRSRGRMSDMHLSVNSFVPKPWTPFQYYAFAPVAELRRKIKFIRKKLAGEPNVRVTADNPDRAFFQAVLARGDRKVGAVLALLRNEREWRRVYKENGIRPEDYAMRERGRFEVFPWDIIDHGISRDYLWAEYQKALAAKRTKPCDTAVCRRCGVCNAGT